MGLINWKGPLGLSREKQPNITEQEKLGADMGSCTGCGACRNICPKEAISMREDPEGFEVPAADPEKCTGCGLCVRACPVITERENPNTCRAVYAARAKGEDRMQSSSGGIFPVLAREILSGGGAAAGVGFTQDGRGACFLLAETEDELDRLRGSKYLQASPGQIYRQVKSCLEQGREVLFTGTPCQVAGLKGFLGKEYPGLYTVDLICHGVPSPKAYRRFLNTVLETTGNAGAGVEEVSFRKKSEWGWSHSFYLRLDNGYVFSKARSETDWYKGFLSGLNCRRSCGQCRFQQIPRIGDLTLGDFWGIEPEKDDGKGTSLVLINSPQGEKLYKRAASGAVWEKTDLGKAKEKNGNLTAGPAAHPNRGRFFRLLDQYEDYDKAVEYAYGRRFDIGYIGWWYGENYGSAITNFALNRYLESLGYSVLMLEWPEKARPFAPLPDTFARRLAKKYYEISVRRTYEELPDLNRYCDMFLVGSDQLWNYWSTEENGSYFFLDFVKDSKKKIAYATSFGHPTYGAPQNVLEETAFHMGRLDYISVREDDGVDVCRNVFGVEAVRTLDPVFLCDRGEYEKLAGESRVREREPYLFAYILSPSGEKREMLEEAARESGWKLILVLDAQTDREKNKQIMGHPEALREEIEMEDWLYYLSHAQAVLTDSYHGLCFSLLFRKKFACVANIRRGLSRFETLMKITGLERNLFLDPMRVSETKAYLEDIDYDTVWRRLDSEIVRSKAWLIHALEAPKAKAASAYDLLLGRLKNLESRVGKIEHEGK